ncbi:hypothetical protein C0995_010971 [Termitomyces sp. Mi166|nr:hypothetical protein C0995_010971 [Termitomyces sp. Mi166\
MARPIELTRLRAADPLRFLTEDPPPHPTPASPIPEPDIFPGALSSDDAGLSAIHPPWKRSLHALLEHPKSSPAAIFLHMLVTFLILISALVTVLETIPTLHEISTGAWFGVETTLVALFTIEYVARCLAWSGTWISLLKWMTTIEVMYISVRRSQHALLAISFFVIMILTVFSTLLFVYFAERGTWDPVLETFVNVDGDPTQFSVRTPSPYTSALSHAPHPTSQSIPAAAWFVLVTITTVGYGEITPRSFLGRLITLPILVFGLLLITLPSFVLGREFSVVWEQMTARQNEREVANSETYPLDSPLQAHFPLSTPLLRGPPSPVQHPARPHSPHPSISYHTTLYSHPPHPSHSPNLLHPDPPHPQTTPSISTSTSTTHTHPGADLTNRKLAQNQTELSMQIAEMRAVLERQGEVVLGLLEVIRGARGRDGAGQGEGGEEQRREEGKGKGKGVERVR